MKISSKYWDFLPWLIFPWMAWAIFFCPIYYPDGIASQFVPIVRIAGGEWPFRDVETIYGPFTYILFGFLFRILGSSIASYKFLTLLNAAASLAAFQALMKRFTSPIFSAFMGLGFALIVCLEGDTCSYLNPHSLSGTQDALFLLLMANCIVRYESNRNIKWAIGAGVCMGIIACMRIEIALIATLFFTVWALLELRPFSRFCAAMAPAALIPLSLYGTLMILATPPVFWQRLMELKGFGYQMGLRSARFYAGVAVTLLFFWQWGHFAKNKLSSQWRHAAGAVLLAAVLCIYLYHKFDYYFHYYVWSITILFLICWLAHNVIKRKFANRSLFYLGMFTVFLHARFFIGNHATYTFPLALALAGIVIYDWFKDTKAAELRPWVLASWILVLGIYLRWNMVHTFKTPKFQMETPWGKMTLKDDELNRALAKISAFIIAHTDKNERILAAPNSFVYFLSGRNPPTYTPLLSHLWYRAMDPAQAKHGLSTELKTIEDIKNHDVRWFVLEKNRRKQVFGEDYGQTLYNWILEHSKQVEEFPAGEGHTFFIFKRLS